MQGGYWLASGLVLIVVVTLSMSGSGVDGFAARHVGALRPEDVHGTNFSEHANRIPVEQGPLALSSC
jgi:hypothetical protein